MNKRKLKTILIVLIILITIILSFNVGVYATYVFSANDVSYTKSNNSTVSVKTALDEVYLKVPIHEIGDEVTVGGEQFYVLEWDNNCDTVNLISKYNLNKDGTAQQDASYDKTACAFSRTDYWNSSFTSSPFNLNDFIGYTATDAMGKAKSYGRSKGAISSRLLSYEEANILKIKSSSNTKINTMYKGTANTADGYLRYWLGSALSANSASTVGGCYNGETYSSYYANEEYDGVRPVITVLKSNVT